jgi:hypothetical protein
MELIDGRIQKKESYAEFSARMIKLKKERIEKLLQN